jgi:hypothetical protein
MSDCMICAGTGVTEGPLVLLCAACEGTGLILAGTCTACDGTGVRTVTTDVLCHCCDGGGLVLFADHLDAALVAQ